MLPVPATHTLTSMTHVDRFGQEQHENHIGMKGVYVGKTTLLRFPSSEDNPGGDVFDDAYCCSAVAGLSLAACYLHLSSLLPCLQRRTHWSGKGCWDREP